MSSWITSLLIKLRANAQAIESVGATVIYLSPYSPDFSPIENCWSKVKEFLRALFGTNLCTIRPSNHRCSGGGHYSRYYRLVYPLLLLCFTQLRTAVSLADNLVCLGNKTRIHRPAISDIKVTKTSSDN